MCLEQKKKTKTKPKPETKTVQCDVVLERGMSTAQGGPGVCLPLLPNAGRAKSLQT